MRRHPTSPAPFSGLRSICAWCGTEAEEELLSYESSAQPIKIGYLMDLRLPEFFPKTYFEDLTQPFDLVFKQAAEQGLIDRPIEIIYREVEGLPKGSVKAVVDAYGELCDEGCLAIFGP